MTSREARSCGRGETTEANLPEGGVLGISNERLGVAAREAIGEVAQRKAFDELFRRLWSVSVEWARTASGGRREIAEDAATQAWFRAWRYRHRFDPDRASYATWLSAIVRNEVADLLRTEIRHTRFRDARSAEDRPDPQTLEPPSLLALSYVWDAFAELRRVHPDWAAALTLKASGYRDRQIAERLGVARVGTVASRLARAKQFMALRLADMGVLFVRGAPVADPPAGMSLLCRTWEGAFYAIDPASGLRLAVSSDLPPGASPIVAEAFLVAVWLDRGGAARSPWSPGAETLGERAG